MDKLSDELTALLKANHVPDEIMKWLGDNNCLTTKNFANWCDAPKDVQANILDNIASHKTSRAALADLKMAWRECDATVARGVKRLSEGLSEIILDEALPDITRDTINETFLKRYQFNFEGYQRPHDGLLGRIRREFERGAPSIISLSKVRSFYSQSQTAEAKRHRVTETISYVIEGDSPDENSAPSKFRHLMARIEVLQNAYGLAGCFVPKKDAPGSATAATPKIYCEWQHVCKFYRDIRNKIEPLLDTCAEATVMEFFVRCEEDLRQKALEHLRLHPDAVFGETLLLMADKHANIYYDHGSVLNTRNNPAAATNSSGSGRVALPGSPAKAGLLAQAANDSQDKGRVATVMETAMGAAICKKYNDRRSCEGKCKDGKTHCCDVLLSSGHACEGRHSRMQHDPGRHGKPQTKS